MSRALAVAFRAPFDAYATPDPLARAICERLSSLQPDSILEPSAGQGPFVRAARAVWPTAHVTAVDIDGRTTPALKASGAHVVLTSDWRLLARQLANVQSDEAVDTRLVIGNPPYRTAEEHVLAALDWMRPGDELAFLLRINFLGSSRRLSFWREAPLAWMAPVVPRPSFTADGGTDGTEYAVFVWRKSHHGVARLAQPITWSNRRNA